MKKLLYILIGIIIGAILAFVFIINKSEETQVGAVICPVCKKCQTLTFNELLKETVRLNPLGKSSAREYIINDTSAYKIITDEGKVYTREDIEANTQILRID